MDIGDEELKKRVMDLWREATDEGIVVNFQSQKDMLDFLKDDRVQRRPAIAMLDNGCVRCVWKTKALREQVGISFHGRGEVNYVLFDKGGVKDAIEYAASTIEVAIGRIDALGLWHLLAKL